MILNKNYYEIRQGLIVKLYKKIIFNITNRLYDSVYRINI